MKLVKVTLRSTGVVWINPDLVYMNVPQLGRNGEIGGRSKLYFIGPNNSYLEIEETPEEINSIFSSV